MLGARHFRTTLLALAVLAAGSGPAFARAAAGAPAPATTRSGHSSTAPTGRPISALDRVAHAYVRLCLEAERLDPEFLDFYVGDAALKRSVARGARPTATALRLRAARLGRELAALGKDEPRGHALAGQIRAVETRLRILAGERLSFPDQLRGLYGLEPPRPFDPADYEPVRAELERILPPGPGGLVARQQAFDERYRMPAGRVPAVADTVLADLRRMAHGYLRLPAHEGFDEVRHVTGSPWLVHSEYRGNGRSRLTLGVDRLTSALSLARALAHETYFGHHAEFTLREEELVRRRGWIEYAVAPFSSPQGVVSEGAAEAGLRILLDDEAYGLWLAQRVFPAAGLPESLAAPAEIARLLAVERARSRLSGLSCQIANLLLSGAITPDSAAALRVRFGLVTREDARRGVRFMQEFGGYVCTYGAGTRLVTAACEAAAAADLRAPRDAARRRFRAILSEPVWPAGLLRPLSREAGDGSHARAPARRGRPPAS